MDVFQESLAAFGRRSYPERLHYFSLFIICATRRCKLERTHKSNPIIPVNGGPDALEFLWKFSNLKQGNETRKRAAITYHRPWKMILYCTAFSAQLTFKPKEC